MRIKFKYSHIYEKHLNPEVEPVPIEKVNTSILEMDTFWKADGPAIEKVFKDITGMSFVDDEIICYINSGKSFSDPLSLQIVDVKDMQDNLIHELAHVLLSGRAPEKAKILWNKYKDEHVITRRHILVHAIHLLLTRNLYPERVERIKTYSKRINYIRSWEIVDQEGAEKIIELVFT